VNSDLGLMEYALKGFRSKPFTASLASVPTAPTHFQSSKVLQIFLDDQHRVAIAVKSVFLVNRLLISLRQQVFSCKGRYQHDER